MCNRSGKLVCLLFFILVLFSGSPLAAEPLDAEDTEKVKSFDSTILVMSDGSIIVREVVTVHAEGIEIRHGILRLLPTNVLNYRNYFIEDDERGKGIYIGQDDFLIPPGDYTYILAYRMEGQLKYEMDYDELYWDVNGDWSFPIDTLITHFIITGADILAIDATIEGKPDGDIEINTLAGGKVDITVTRKLMPNESLGVRMTWRLTDAGKQLPSVVFGNLEDVG